MKHSILFFTSIWLLTFHLSIVEAHQQGNQPQQKTVAPQEELFVKHGGEEHTKRNEKFDLKYIKKALMIMKDREEVDNFSALINIGPAIRMYAGTTNRFWKDYTFQEKIFSDYISRIHLIPREVEKGWATALGKIEGLDGSMASMYTLGVIILQDQLFDKNSFQQQEAAKLLKRLTAIPEEAIVKWAEVRKLDKFQAAVSLMRLDSLFINDAFQLNLFTETLK